MSFRDRPFHNNDAISALRAVDFEGDQAFLRLVSDEVPQIINNTAQVETLGKRREGKHALKYFAVATMARKMELADISLGSTIRLLIQTVRGFRAELSKDHPSTW